MINVIPFLGWFLSFFFSASLAVPFYFLWNHLCPKYMPFVPPIYAHLPFWDCVWIFMLLSILKGLLPTFSSVTQNAENKSK